MANSHSRIRFNGQKLFDRRDIQTFANIIDNVITILEGSGIMERVISNQENTSLWRFFHTQSFQVGGVLEADFNPSMSSEPYVHTREQILKLVRLLHNQAISNPSTALNIETRASALHMARELAISRNNNRIAISNLQAANVAAEQVRLGLRHAALQPNGNRPDRAQRDAVLNRGPIPTQPALSFRAEANAEARARGEAVNTPNRNPTVTTPNRNPTAANPVTVERTPTGNRRVERNVDAILRIDNAIEVSERQFAQFMALARRTLPQAPTLNINDLLMALQRAQNTPYEEDIRYLLRRTIVNARAAVDDEQETPDASNNEEEKSD